MNPQEAYDRLRVAIPKRPELRNKDWPNLSPKLIEVLRSIHPYQGGCFIATQVFVHLVEDAVPYSNPDRSHFWAQIGEDIWDPTFDQFDEFDYSVGKRTRFKTFSKRSQELLNECLTTTPDDS